jgi:hypothetical protein
MSNVKISKPIATLGGNQWQKRKQRKEKQQKKQQKDLQRDPQKDRLKEKPQNVRLLESRCPERKNRLEKKLTRAWLAVKEWEAGLLDLANCCFLRYHNDLERTTFRGFCFLRS